jgi:hypothetical protein
MNHPRATAEKLASLLLADNWIQPQISRQQLVARIYEVISQEDTKSSLPSTLTPEDIKKWFWGGADPLAYTNMEEYLEPLVDCQLIDLRK